MPPNRHDPGVGLAGAVVGGDLQGRGAADMKGALAALLLIAYAIGWS